MPSPLAARDAQTKLRALFGVIRPNGLLNSWRPNHPQGVHDRSRPNKTNTRAAKSSPARSLSSALSRHRSRRHRQEIAVGSSSSGSSTTNPDAVRWLAVRPKCQPVRQAFVRVLGWLCPSEGHRFPLCGGCKRCGKNHHDQGGENRWAEAHNLGDAELGQLLPDHRGDGPGLALEPLLQIRISRHMLGQHLDGDGAVQAGVGGFIDLAHTSRANYGLGLKGVKKVIFLEPQPPPPLLLPGVASSYLPCRLLLLRLFQHTPICSVGVCPAQDSPRVCPSFSANSPPKTPADSIWLRAGGRTDSCVRAVGAGTRNVLVDQRRWQCTGCRHQVSLTSGTVLHNAKLPLTQWFWAAYLMTTDTRGITDAGVIETGAGPGRVEWLDGSRDPVGLDLAPTQAPLRSHGLRLSLRYEL